MHYARKSIITPEMECVLLRESLNLERMLKGGLRFTLATGQSVVARQLTM